MSNEANGAGSSSLLRRAIVVLTGICLASGAGVGLLYWHMRDDIQAQKDSVFRTTLAVVLGEAKDYPLVGEYPADTPADERVYANLSGSPALYATVGIAKGYQSEIKVLVSVEGVPDRPVDADPVIHTVAVVESQETPGLGENIKSVERDVSIWGAVAGQKSQPRRPWFQEQFSGKRLSDLKVVKHKGEPGIVAITGATITSEATTKAVRDAVARIIERTDRAYGK